ncbi:EAL domain-containing protein [Stenotrophomonas sp. PA-6-5C]|uniref:bifunctional diguanylate cyclase/phosphodiesterase n=1 Tax=Stenotrophomonas sp. PA-6-5C TaxID=2665487 RepID=UPI001F179E93|nr:EAL domain-containing protein [Stenotrophomonas sp. PA-6-5C]MCF5092466.1 EAL domain-containing protein [Stenotrophomonas sp. PA-6-5C]
MQDGSRRQEWRSPAVEVGDVEESFAHEASRLPREDRPMPALRHALARPLRAITWGGVVLGVLLAVGLAAMLANDYQRRLEAAQRQSRALAIGSERLLALELRNLERAMEGIAADAAELFRTVPAQAPALLDAAIAGVLRRHAELHSIVVLDTYGRALTAGKGDLQLPLWTDPQRRGQGSALYIGPPQRANDGGWVVPLALPMAGDRWLLARLRCGELQRIVGGLDVGPSGLASISDADGYMLARVPDPHGTVGRRYTLPARTLLGRQAVVELGSIPGAVDHIPRISTISTLERSPLAVQVGLANEDVLKPWWPYLQAAIVIVLAYVALLLVLLYAVRRSTHRQQSMAEELHTGHAELRLAHQVGRVCTWYVDEDAALLRWSPLAREIFGVQTDALPVAEFFARVHHDDSARMQQAFDQAFAGTAVLDEEFRLVLPGGAVRWVAARGQRVAVADRQRRMIGALTDLSERYQAHEQMRQVERRFRLLFDRNPAPFWVFDPDTLRFIEVNEAAVQQYGYSRDEFLAMSILDIRPREGWDEVKGAIAQVRSGELQDAAVRLHQRKDGSVFEVRVHLSQLDFDGQPACLVLAEDVSERLAYERDLAYHARHNPATGLLNVRALSEQLDEQSGAYTIAYVQLRGLQLVADTLGREIGDAVLQSMASRLGGLGARFGLLAFQPAEDFVLAIAPEHNTQRVLDDLLQIVSAPMRGQDSLHQFEPRIGVAVHDADAGHSAEQAIGMAAQAAHAARAEGNVVAWFDAAVTTRLADRLRLAGRIHAAIDNEFQLYFQPIRHASDGSPASLEALLRWPQADGSFIPPSEFIQLCEDTGLILALGRWVIRAAAQAQRRLVEAGWGELSIAVNVSAVQFFNSDLVAEFARAQQDFGLARGALHVELTESSLMRKPAQAMQTMQRLHEQGISVSLDDFGTGYSSMSYLQHLPLDILKIDRSFVADVETNPRNASICRALLSLGHSMGLTIIAEGVETPGQLDWLAAHGCDQVQGYLLGRPAPLEKIIAQLDEVAA